MCPFEWNIKCEKVGQVLKYEKYARKRTYLENTFH